MNEKRGKKDRDNYSPSLTWIILGFDCQPRIVLLSSKVLFLFYMSKILALATTYHWQMPQIMSFELESDLLLQRRPFRGTLPFRTLWWHYWDYCASSSCECGASSFRTKDQNWIRSSCVDNVERWLSNFMSGSQIVFPYYFTYQQPYILSTINGT